MSPVVLFACAVVAGGLGAGLRYVVDALVMRERTDAFPLGILIVNVSGSLVLGVVAGLGSALAGDVFAIVGIGLLGGYTTFSTVSLDTAMLARRGRGAWALANAGITLVAATAAAAVGIAVGSLFG